MVTSTIPRERLEYLSDRHWLGIARGNWPRRSHNWKPMGPDLIGEASAEMFAGDLGSDGPPAAEAVRPTGPPHAAGHGIEVRRRYFQRPGPDRASREYPGQGDREVAGVEDIEAILERFGHLAGDRDFATGLCWAVQRRPSEVWSDATLGLLGRIASEHPHPHGPVHGLSGPGTRPAG